MQRVVLDTNVVVSAYLNPDGVPFLILKLALEGQIRTFVSEPILAEYAELLERKRYSMDHRRARWFLRAVRAVSDLVRPTLVASAALDPDDNIFLECAHEAKANFLVTGNIRDYPAPKWKYTRIVTPREFIEEWTHNASRGLTRLRRR